MLVVSYFIRFISIEQYTNKFMDSTNQIQSLIEQVDKNPEYKISEQEAKGFLSEIKRLTKEDKTHMPPLIVIIMAYINMLFPELDEVKA